MCFKPKCLSNLFIPDMYFNGEVLTTVGKIKYLSAFIDCDAHDNDDSMYHVKAIYTRDNILISKFKICNDDVKSRLFQSYLSIVYGYQLWTNYKPTVLNKANVTMYTGFC